MEKQVFVHLNLKSEYSLLNSILKTSDIISWCEATNSSSIALTDLNSMHNAYHFQEKCRAAGIKPITGVTFCIKYSDSDFGSITLLALNRDGYKNLVCLSTIANKGIGKNGFPHLKFETLKKYGEGLVCLTGGTSGIFFRNYSSKKDWTQYLDELRNIYKENLYFEFQNHLRKDEIEFLSDESVCNELKARGIEAVASNDVYYLKKEHAFHRSLALEMNPNPNGLNIYSGQAASNSEWYLKTPDEIEELFKDYLRLYPNLLQNTVKIAERCKGEVSVEKAFPQFPIPEGFTSEEYLRKLAYDGFEEKFGNFDKKKKEKYKERLEYELGVITQMGFVDYHLITADFIQWAKDDKVYEHPEKYFPKNYFPSLESIPEKLWKKDSVILVGPGRGSAAGSLLCYCLKITNLDPIEDGLLFERFLNVERVSMPVNIGHSV